MRKKGFFKIIVFFIGITFSQFSTAEFIVQDLYAEGDGLLTYDDVTGLQYLDFTVSAGMTYNEVNAELGTNGMFEGFRIANWLETETFSYYANAYDYPATFIKDLLDKVGYSYNQTPTLFSGFLALISNERAIADYPNENWGAGMLFECLSMYEEYVYPACFADSTLLPSYDRDSATPVLLIYTADNCPAIDNPDQLDTDGDGLGDPCDSCPLVPNPDQRDTDGDGLADACDDLDDDNDGVDDTIDNCPVVVNPEQTDGDGNGIGDACQDTDSDMVLDIVDNCPVDANTNQRDSDGDGLGDACDLDDDNDLILDITDNCPLDVNPDQKDTDYDGQGDVCDWDDDNDGVDDWGDNCPVDSNPYQVDFDRDGLGDACDPDDDNDGVIDTVDNCRIYINPDQLDTDSDGAGNACDKDDDNDGVLDIDDNCPVNANADQADSDGDGIGDVCEPITVTQALYTVKGDKLVVKATSVLNSKDAALQLVGYGSMRWNKKNAEWSITVRNVGGNPGAVVVSGAEGAVTAVVTQ